MQVSTSINNLRLKQGRLGIAVDPDGRVYVADAQGDSPRVYVLPRSQFVEAVRTRRISAQEWSLVVPRRECLLKNVTLPARTDEEVAKMLEFEVPGLIPAQEGEICYGIVDIREAEEGYRQATVMIAPANCVETAGSALREAGVLPDVVVPSSLALQRWLQGRLSAGQRRRCSLLLCIDTVQLQSIVMAGGRLIAAKDIAVRNLSDLDVGLILLETQRSFDRVQREDHSRSIEQIVVCGQPAVAEQLAQDIRTLAANVAGLLDPEVIVFPGAHVVSEYPEEDLSNINALSAAGASGTAPPDGSSEFSMAPSGWVKARQRRRVWRERVKTACAMVLALLSIEGYLVARNHRLEVERDRILKQIQPIQDVATALEAKKQQVRVIQSQLMCRSLPLDILAELHKRVPDRMYLSHLVMDLNARSPEVSMRGTAGSLDLAFGFPMALEQSSLFRDVRPEGAQQVSRGTESLIEYGCRCRVNPVALGRGKQSAQDQKIRGLPTG